MCVKQVLNVGTGKLHVISHCGMVWEILEGLFCLFSFMLFLTRFWVFIETVAERCSGKKVFWIFLKLIGNNLASRQSLGSFLVRLQASRRQLYDKLSYLAGGFQGLCLDFKNFFQNSFQWLIQFFYEDTL